MPKRIRKTQQPTNPPLDLDAYLSTYDPVSITALLVDLERSSAWEIFRSFLKVKQREFEVAALDLIRHKDHEQEAAHASGYAQACEDIAERVMQEFKDKITGVNKAVIDNPEEVQIEDHPPVEA